MHGRCGAMVTRCLLIATRGSKDNHQQTKQSPSRAQNVLCGPILWWSQGRHPVSIHPLECNHSANPTPASHYISYIIYFTKCTMCFSTGAAPGGLSPSASSVMLHQPGADLEPATLNSPKMNYPKCVHVRVSAMCESQPLLRRTLRTVPLTMCWRTHLVVW